MDRITEAFRLINNIVRVGTIAEVDVSRARARVKAGDNLTGWRPWASARTGTTIDWDPPTVGEQVVLFSPAGDLAQSIIFTGLYAGNAPKDSADIYHRQFPDGSRITYDHQKKLLDVHLSGEATINVTGDATLNIGGNAKAAVGGNCDLDVTKVCKVNAQRIHHNGGKGVVTQGHICHFTGNPHGDGSSTVTAGK
jgi:phage baseplate assembly protein V